MPESPVPEPPVPEPPVPEPPVPEPPVPEPPVPEPPMCSCPSPLQEQKEVREGGFLRTANLCLFSGLQMQ